MPFLESLFVQLPLVVSVATLYVNPMKLSKYRCVKKVKFFFYFSRMSKSETEEMIEIEIDEREKQACLEEG